MRGRKKGINYVQVDEILYALLDTPTDDTDAPSGGGRGGSRSEGGVERRSLAEWMVGAKVVVVGSVVPWYEVVALESGAEWTLTLEYNKVDYHHPRMHSHTPEHYWAERRRYAERNAGSGAGGGDVWAGDFGGVRFDVGLSISSIEHAGLGRYGDALDPAADMKAMRELEALVRDDGLLILAVL